MGKGLQKAVTRRRIDHDPILLWIRVSLGFAKVEKKAKWDWMQVQRALTYGSPKWDEMVEAIEKRLKEEVEKPMEVCDPEGRRQKSRSRSSMTYAKLEELVREEAIQKFGEDEGSGQRWKIDARRELKVICKERKERFDNIERWTKSGAVVWGKQLKGVTKHGKEAEKQGYQNIGRCELQGREANIVVKIMEAEMEKVMITSWQGGHKDIYNARGWRTRGWGGKVRAVDGRWKSKGGGEPEMVAEGMRIRYRVSGDTGREVVGYIESMQGVMQTAITTARGPVMVSDMVKLWKCVARRNRLEKWLRVDTNRGKDKEKVQ